MDHASAASGGPTAARRRGRATAAAAGCAGPASLPARARHAPSCRTRRERFDDLVLAIVTDVDARWQDRLGLVEYAVEDTPQLPDDWEADRAAVVAGARQRRHADPAGAVPPADRAPLRDPRRPGGDGADRRGRAGRRAARHRRRATSTRATTPTTDLLADPSLVHAVRRRPVAVHAVTTPTRRLFTPTTPTRRRSPSTSDGSSRISRQQRRLDASPRQQATGRPGQAGADGGDEAVADQLGQRRTVAPRPVTSTAPLIEVRRGSTVSSRTRAVTAARCRARASP